MCDYELQASPAVLAMLSWDDLREICKELKLTEASFLPWQILKANSKVEIFVLLYKGVEIEILKYKDEKGINVVSFDPARRLHGIKSGQHRL